MDKRNAHKVYTCLCGLAIGAAIGGSYHAWRSARDATYVRQAVSAGTLAPLPTAESIVDIRDEYSRAFAQCMDALQGKDVAADWALAEGRRLTAIELLAKRDATTQILLEGGDPHAALRIASTMAGTVCDSVGLTLVEEVALAWAMRDATAAVAAVKDELPRPTQLRVFEFLEKACPGTYPEVSVLAHLQYMHEEANAQATWTALRDIRGATGSIKIVMPKAQRKTLFLAIAKYLGGTHLNMRLLTALARSDDRWSAAQAMGAIIEPSQAFGVLEQLMTLPGWERQEALVAQFIRKWALVENLDTVEAWIAGKTAGRLRLEVLRNLRNAMLTKGEFERAAELSTRLREEMNDREALVADANALQSPVVRAAALSQVRLEGALTLLMEWKLDPESVQDIRKQANLTAEAAAGIEAIVIAKECNTPGDWVSALRNSSAIGDASLSAALATIVTREKWPLAVQLANSAASDSESNQILQVYVGQAGFAQFGGEYFINETALLKAGSIPEAAEARSYAFDQWIVKDMEAASGWLADNVQEERNAGLVTTLITQLQHSDPEAALAWIGALKSPEERNKALESLEALARGRGRRN